MVRNYGQQEGKRVSTPMEENLKVKTPEINEDSEYRAIIGSLLYLSRGTRPDISYAVNFLSRFNGRSTKEVMAYARRVIRYLNYTKDLKLKFNSNKNSLKLFVDASFAPNL